MNAAAQALTAQIHTAVLALGEIEQKWIALSERPESERCNCYANHMSELRGKMQSSNAAIELMIAKRASAPWMGA